MITLKSLVTFISNQECLMTWSNETMKKFAQACEEAANVEKPAKLEGRNMLMFLAPKPTK